MQSIIARYIGYSIDQHCLLCKVYKKLYNFCLTQVFVGRILTSKKVTREQYYECKYPVFGSVWFRSEQISAVTDPGPEHCRPDCTNTTRNRKVIIKIP